MEVTEVPNTRVMFTRSPDPIGACSPGTWREIEVREGRKTALVGCPSCGALGTIEDHRIDAMGMVEPSVICARECGFDAKIILDTWLMLTEARQ